MLCVKKSDRNAYIEQFYYPTHVEEEQTHARKFNLTMKFLLLRMGHVIEINGRLLHDFS